MELNITASIVLFNSNADEIEHVISCFTSKTLHLKLYLIDNSKNDDLKYLGNVENVEYIFLGKNIGYGAAHNVAISLSGKGSPYHLVLNPDISFKPEIIEQAFRYMENNSKVGMLSPKILYPDGRPQHMCRMLPTPFDLIARRFMPGFIKPFFRKSLNNYTLEKLDYKKIHNIPNLPGSFMFLRNKALKEVGGFDENFFMYLEDIDLTRRIHTKYDTIYYPDIEITHALEQGSYKSGKLLKYHIQSALYYFNKWGWFNDEARSKINKSLEKKLKND
ncbi:glycosyltransferase [Pedobacter sp. GR22-10]|uniref:glycosyltransferase n=1 Tax=Pedobacter sp. GR22-10 TaxID=2994472 RepID=UPI0022476D9E|nr:glycosyltransferase family 2 protein [Pedobacter sp. GR22-10]MCX2432372.1 glycosyltransferase family 2 protein [Pedobacter sp. GR22-10]